MTIAHLKCVANNGALGKRFEVRCVEHGVITLPMDVDSARDELRRHLGLHTTVTAIVGDGEESA